VIFWATGAALFAGTLHVGISAVRRFVMHEFIWVSRDFVWMTPLGYLALFLALALPVSLLAATVPRLVQERGIAFLYSALAVLAVTLTFPRLHPLASVVVAMGVGVRAAALRPVAMATPRPWVPRWALAAIAALVAVATVGDVLSRTRESRALAALPTVQSETPNVLLIILDTVRAASMSFMGYPRVTTPEIARAASQGTTFDNAYSVAPWTLPSHAGIFTARYPSALSADWTVPLDDQQPTLAEVFVQGGYVTAGFTANNFYTSWESGLTRGFVHYEDYRRTWKQVLLSTTFLQTNFFWAIAHDLRPSNIARELARLDLRTRPMWTGDRKPAALVGSDFLEWESSRGKRPFFAFLNLYDAHLPYDPPDDWSLKFAAKPTDLDRYDGAIGYMDHEVGRVLNELGRRGILDNTVVIITSDHGEAFGEHGLYEHGNSLYRHELHVPLVVRYPARAPAGHRVTAPVSLRDMGATLFDLTGLRTSRPFGGSSLAASWGVGGASPSAVVAEVSAGINSEPSAPVSRGAMRSLIDSTAHYIRNGDGVEELYAYRDDPGEVHDIARINPARVAALRAAARQAVGASLAKR
jgi:arylsulfatase A-like enzyme